MAVSLASDLAHCNDLSDWANFGMAQVLGYTLINSTVALAGYYAAAFTVDKPWMGRRRMQVMDCLFILLEQVTLCLVQLNDLVPWLCACVVCWEASWCHFGNRRTFSFVAMQIMGFAWMAVLFLLCAWGYQRLTQPSHLWIFRALYYLSRSAPPALSSCNGLRVATDCQVAKDGHERAHVVGPVSLQLLWAVGPKRHHMAAPIGEHRASCRLQHVLAPNGQLCPAFSARIIMTTVDNPQELFPTETRAMSHGLAAATGKVQLQPPHLAQTARPLRA